MQSLLRPSLNKPQQEKILNSKAKTVSIIPKISEPKNLLPSNFPSSKPPLHLFIQGFHDIKAESSSMHKLYDPNSNHNKQSDTPPIFSLQFHLKDQTNNKRKSNNQFKFQNLKHFLLFETQNILFLSRSICLILNEEENKRFTRLTSFHFAYSSNNDQKQIQSYQNESKQLAKVLLENQKFPFLCPQLNQTPPQNSSFHNLSLQSNQECLLFDDNFQSSNILMVKKIQNLKPQIPTYCICTRFDYQTASYGQWFYFSVKWPQSFKEKQDFLKDNFSIKKSRKFKFMIFNMTKQYSLLGNCMKISVCRNGVWGKQGQNIRYYETIFHRSNKVQNQIDPNLSNKKNHQFHYALEFDLELRKGQKIYVSYNEPYTVTRLSNLLDNFHQIYSQIQINTDKINKVQKVTAQNSQTDTEMNINKSQQKLKNTSKQPVYYKKQIICETPLKNQIFCLTFSMRKQFTHKTFIQQSAQNHQEISEKKIIFILARAHPIQTAGSFVIEGILKNLFLFTEYKNSIKERADLKSYFEGQNKGKLLQNLLKNFIVKIIPLINPDGVIIGNSRCNFHGYDLNRQWKRSNKILSKEVFSLKRFLLKYKGRIQMVIDLHGHSKEKNVFAYGMHDFRDPFVTRQFPFILSKLVTHNFNFNQCKFTRLKNPPKQRVSVQKKSQILNSKQGTARIWLFRKLSIPNIFTIENSYCGSTNSLFHYDSVSYNQIGKQILLGMCMYYLNYSQKKVQKAEKNDPKLEDETINQFMNKNSGLEDLMRFKDSLILDLKNNEFNASIGLDDINTSQSQEEYRIQDEIKEIKNNELSPEKRKLSSPNKLTYHSAVKKPFETQQKSDINKQIISSHRYSQKSQGEQVYNFRYRLNHRNQKRQQNQNSSTKQKIVVLNHGFSRRQLNSESKLRFQELQYHKKSLPNRKSTSELQRNTALSIVEVGWDQSKLIEGKICDTERVYPNDNQNDWLNFPQIKSPAINDAIFTHRSNLNLKFKQLNNINCSTNSTFNKQLENKIDKPQLEGPPQNNLKNAQLKKNVNEFIKKLQSNRKLQNEMVMTRKIQKYKQIIMKINGNQNL